MTPAVKKVLGFIRPYLPAYIPGLLIFTSQGFIFGGLINAILMNMLTAAILVGDVTEGIAGVWRAMLVFLGLTVGYLIIVGFGLFASEMTNARATRDFQQRVFRSFVTDNIENAMSSHSGEGIAAINTDVETAAGLYGNAIVRFMFAFTSILGSAITVFVIDWRIGLAAAGMGGVFLFAQSRFAKPLGRIGKKRLEVNAASVSAASNIFAGGIAIRAFKIQDRALLTFNAENDKLLRLNFKEAFIGMWQNLFTTVQGWSTIVIVAAFGGWLVATGDESLSFPALMMALPMCMAMSGGIEQIGVAIAGFQGPKEAAERISKILESPGVSTKPYKKVENDGYTLTLDNLSFKYKDADAPILKNISLEIRENETIAFVGASGSGKSTLLRAIIGLYEREDLKMRLGSLDFSPADAETWRHRFAYVDQSCKLFDMSVAENIALGADGTASEDEIKKAVARAAADFIEALPEGYATLCGEKGASLSGGQKQRIAIARALCRKAPILVFDEATSALDAESERSIMQTIENLRGGHTILIVTHNLQNTVSADKIVVLHENQIAETGTHDELLAKNGVYHALYAQQAEKK